MRKLNEREIRLLSISHLEKGTELNHKGLDFGIYIERIMKRSNSIWCELIFSDRTDDCADDIAYFIRKFCKENKYILLEDLLKQCKVNCNRKMIQNYTLFLEGE